MVYVDDSSPHRGFVELLKVKVKWSRYRPSLAQRVVRGIALLFYDRDTRRGWVVSSTPRPHFTPGKDPVPILQEAGWAPGPVWTGGKSRPHRDSIPNRPARSQSLYRLSYRAHKAVEINIISLQKLDCSEAQLPHIIQLKTSHHSLWYSRVKVRSTSTISQLMCETHELEKYSMCQISLTGTA